MRFLLVIGLLLSSGAYGQLRQLESDYIDERNSKKRSFRTLPGTHISPRKGSFMFGVMSEHIDSEIESESDQGKERLNLDGQSFAPYFAMSGKFLGAGLMVERGDSHASFKRERDLYSEKSRLFYEGVGTHVFYNPVPTAKSLSLNFIFASKFLGISHRAKANAPIQGLDSGEWEKVEYRLIRNQIGTNLNVKILKNLSIIPWTNLTQTAVEDPSAGNNIKLKKRFAADREIFWRPGIEHEYGLDIALRLFSRVEIHFGNLIGYAISQLNPVEGRIQDRSFNLSLIYVIED